MMINLTTSSIIVNVLHSQNNIGLRRQEWADQPNQKENDLNTADDEKSSQKSHCASDKAKLCLNLDFPVSLYVVKGCRVEVDLNCQITHLEAG